MNRSHLTYSNEPEDDQRFTNDFDEFYTRFARIYDLLLKGLPFWQNWLRNVLPHLQGPRVLEVSFGTGYLLTQYADRFETYGLDYNAMMARITKQNLSVRGLKAELQQADVNYLPYADGSFDTLINTMAFSGYADGRRALAEMERVLKPGGRLVLIDINYPKNQNRIGMNLVRFWMAAGDIIRDMGRILNSSGWKFREKEVGGFGSVHLYVASKS